jgi:hypothetical protein
MVRRQSGIAVEDSTFKGKRDTVIFTALLMTTNKREIFDNHMKILRALGLLVLAILYFGGTFAQISGAAFPLVGTGRKTVGDFKGRTKSPVIPTISPRRHMPMVKPVEVSPALPVDRPEFGQPEEFCVSTAPDNNLSLLSTPIFACGARAPPTL